MFFLKRAKHSDSKKTQKTKKMKISQNSKCQYNDYKKNENYCKKCVFYIDYTIVYLKLTIFTAYVREHLCFFFVMILGLCARLTFITLSVTKKQKMHKKT